MLRPTLIYLLIFTVTMCFCGKKTENKGLTEFAHDSLSIFPLDMHFVSTNANDQIALLLERDETNTFKYRIELLRKWRGLPLDYGVVQLQNIEADSVFVFRGGNTDCDVVIKIYNSKRKFELFREYVELERNCKDDSLDIAMGEFDKLWYK